MVCFVISWPSFWETLKKLEMILTKFLLNFFNSPYLKLRAYPKITPLLRGSSVYDFFANTNSITKEKEGKKSLKNSFRNFWTTPNCMKLLISSLASLFCWIFRINTLIWGHWTVFCTLNWSRNVRRLDPGRFTIFLYRQVF